VPARPLVSRQQVPLERVSERTLEMRIRTSIEAFVAAWNERDPERRMRLIEQGCAEDVAVRTPGRRIDGRAALDALMADFQRRQPDKRAVFTSGVDVQGHSFRYAGMIEDAITNARGGETFDAGACDDDGRIRFLLSFVGAELPQIMGT
jgi:hypothetical protein